MIEDAFEFIYWVSLALFCTSLVGLCAFFFFSFRSAQKRELRRKLRSLEREILSDSPKTVVTHSLDNIVAGLDKYQTVDDLKVNVGYFGHQVAKTFASRLVADQNFRALLYNHTLEMRGRQNLQAKPEYLEAFLTLMQVEFRAHHRGSVSQFAKERMLKGSNLWMVERVFLQKLIDWMLSRHEVDFFQELRVSLFFLSDIPLEEQQGGILKYGEKTFHQDVSEIVD